MKNLKTYYVPVKCTLTTTLAIDAINQVEALNQVNKIMEKNADSITDRYDSALIMYADITCKQDDEMIDEMAKDLNLKPEVSDTPCVRSLGEDTSNKEYQTITANISIDGEGMPNCISKDIPKAVNDIVIYTGTECPWCHKTIKYLQSKHLLFVEKNVNTHSQFKDEMINLTRQSSLPALIINGKIVLGFDKRQIEASLNA